MTITAVSNINVRPVARPSNTTDSRRCMQCKKLLGGCICKAKGQFIMSDEEIESAIDLYC